MMKISYHRLISSFAHPKLLTKSGTFSGTRDISPDEDTVLVHRRRRFIEDDPDFQLMQLRALLWEAYVGSYRVQERWLCGVEQVTYRVYWWGGDRSGLSTPGSGYMMMQDACFCPESAV
jgi:hypothetical protein